MKAIMVTAPGKIDIIEKDLPKIQSENEILVRIKAVGICGSDMHIYHGTNPLATYPRVIGHEFVGEVVETGAGVTRVKAGDRVTIEPILYCGECYACRTERQNVCEKLEVMGVHRDGGFQEFVVVPEKNAHKFDEHLDWEEAVMIEPFTIAAQSTWRGDVRKGDYVFIMGAGPIGLCLLQYAKHKGAICMISDLDIDRLEIAKKLGADYILHAGQMDVVEEVLKITQGMGANVTLDAVCIPKTFEQAVEVTSVAGRVVVLGFGVAPSQIPQLPITKRELTIVGSRLQNNKFPEVVELFNKKALNPRALISHTFQFDQIEEAIKLIETQSEKTCKVILKF
ncbi:zinc-binding alcohol dehydrogenase family protein [Geosporobacter ferrireducens]|uniref:Alcohol dehydrogenase n=1 Tax=Geosporobacter ferrireducens TaxID=1424294 RepID=A0A1D8GIG7_9FIRM|nr:zinc-binding alcohol dehydrogenase family protein [Geosporobacter ferrireducens]AOT70715.1 alcohol dehydrogenase [Geosporobacter ferrireducens]MTI57522.1 zinc-binding alcohol dehydrogenase family protein [Geosporobacter ferrireducens]